MTQTILLGRGRQILEVPHTQWEKHLAEAPQHMQARLAFMSEAHHAVRYFAVRELARRGEALPPQVIARELELPLDRTRAILDDLERHLFFLVRDERGDVVWAYPVTVARTPHPLTFSSGERLYAA
ncbi:MAG: hypothetical protein Kow0063_10590 [Anaerolineae bacterium]